MVNKKTVKTDSKSVKSESLKSKFVKYLRQSSYAGMLEAAVVGLLGLIFIFNPTTTALVIAYTVGFFFIIKGIFAIINYFVAGGQYDFFNNDLLYGLVGCFLGVALIIAGPQLGTLINAAAGIWMIFSSVVRLNSALKLRALKIKEWIYVLVLSLALFVIGIYILLNTTATISLIGWAMLIGAIVGICNEYIFLKHVDAVFNTKGKRA